LHTRAGSSSEDHVHATNSWGRLLTLHDSMEHRHRDRSRPQRRPPTERSLEADGANLRRNLCDVRQVNPPAATSGTALHTGALSHLAFDLLEHIIWILISDNIDEVLHDGVQGVTRPFTHNHFSVRTILMVFGGGCGDRDAQWSAHHVGLNFTPDFRRSIIGRGRSNTGTKPIQVHPDKESRDIEKCKKLRGGNSHVSRQQRTQLSSYVQELLLRLTDSPRLL
ncbi:hypothetical protein N9L68_09195, partial [bacterium]|nr:hypothetical protein [bacterium]